jgi:hypothetical protein
MITKDEIPGYAPETIDLPDGSTATIKIEPDEHHGPPWKEYDGHGIVSDWTRRAKKPGELILAEDGGLYRYYDFAESVKIARRDGWGASGSATPGERAHKATMADYKYLRGWCNDLWQWVGVVVEVERPDGTREVGSLWGIESLGDYWREVAADLINELTGGVQ